MIKTQWPPINSITSIPWFPADSQTVPIQSGAARIQLHIHHHHLRGRRSNSQPTPSFMHKVAEQMFLSDNVSSSAHLHNHLPSFLSIMYRSFNHHSNGFVLYKWSLNMQLCGKIGLTKEPQLPTRGDSRKPESKINIRLCHEPTQEAAAPVICDEFRELENRMALNRCYIWFYPIPTIIVRTKLNSPNVSKL